MSAVILMLRHLNICPWTSPPPDIGTSSLKQSVTTNFIIFVAGGTSLLSRYYHHLQHHIVHVVPCKSEFIGASPSYL